MQHFLACCFSASCSSLRMRSAWIWKRVLWDGRLTSYMPLGYGTPNRVPWPPASRRTATLFSDIRRRPVWHDGRLCEQTHYSIYYSTQFKYATLLTVKDVFTQLCWQKAFWCLGFQQQYFLLDYLQIRGVIILCFYEAHFILHKLQLFLMTHTQP